MVTISPFEVLLQSIMHGNQPGSDPIPKVIQAYFLRITRLPKDDIVQDIELKLHFPSTPFDPNQLIITVEDENGNNRDISPFQSNLTFFIGLGKTISVGLQPNLSQTNILSANFAFRGYADISLVRTKKPQSTELLLLPLEIRRTFLPSGESPIQISPKNFTEAVYSLPTTRVGNLFTLSAEAIPNKSQIYRGHEVSSTLNADTNGATKELWCS